MPFLKELENDEEEKQVGCCTDVNGVLVYMPPTSEYSSLLKSGEDELPRLVSRILTRLRDQKRDQVIIIALVQTLPVKDCSILYTSRLN